MASSGRRSAGRWDPGDAADREPDDVAVAEDRRAHRARDLLDLLLPALRVGVGDRLLADDPVEDEVEQPVLRADVPVQRAGGGASVRATWRMLSSSRPSASSIARAASTIASCVSGSRRWRGARCGRASTGWRDVGVVVRSAFSHLNSVQVLNTLHTPGAVGSVRRALRLTSSVHKTRGLCHAQDQVELLHLARRRRRVARQVALPVLQRRDGRRGRRRLRRPRTRC